MSEENARMTGAEVGRWLVLGLLLGACIVLYFQYGPTTPTVLHPGTVDASP
jgi:hypothetical protein